MILLLHLALSTAYAVRVPLGETPDEPAHLNYSRFIAEKGRLPATLAEREAAGYRSVWPPLYHFLAGRPLAMLGDAPPTHLKSVGDTPRRLLPANGQTIAAFVHTQDEAWPWQGITLAWHLGRFFSVLLTALAVGVTYAIAWRLTRRRDLALAAAALHAFTPQVLFIGGALNDDNLLFLLSGLTLLALIIFTQQETPPTLFQAFLLGALLGLATMAKYNALPLWPLAFAWFGWLLVRSYSPLSKRFMAALLTRGLALLAGALVTTGWWFGFVWVHFNQVDSRGWLQGSLAALSAGSSGVSGETLQQLGRGIALTVPGAGLWLEWFSRLFQSFWGRFGGGGSIELPAWSYWLLFVFCLLAVIPYVWRIAYFVFRIAYSIYKKRFALRPTPPAAKTSSLLRLPSAQTFFLFLSPFFFLTLPLLRFMMSSGNIIETARGRHLYPALPAIVLALVWGLAKISRAIQKKLNINHLQYTIHNSLPLLAFVLSLYALFLIPARYPPRIPLRTTPDAAAVEHPIHAELADGLKLVGYDLDPAANGTLPITLVWQATQIPPEDYALNLTLIDEKGRLLGNWLGQPVGGRYPTRAWDKHDILRDTIVIPLLPGVAAAEAALVAQLLDTQLYPVGDTITLHTALDIPAAAAAPLAPSHLRADGLPPNDPFTYRGTLTYILPDVTRRPELVSPSGQTFTPAQFITGPGGSLAHFLVDAYWPAGTYHLSPTPNPFPPIPIENRPRHFTPPEIEHPLNANFAGRITLLGYDLPQRRIDPGGSFPLTLHMRANRTMGQNLVIFNHLLDANAIQRGGADRIPQQYYTTLLWVPGEVVSDEYQVPVNAEAPPGIYWLDVGFYPDDHPAMSLPLVVEGEVIDRNSVSIGPIKVGGPPPNVTDPNAQPQQPVNQSFGNQITLLGYNLTPTGNPPLLTLYWQATVIPPADYTIFVHLLDAEGNLAAQFDGPPANGAYPTSLWNPGEIIVDRRTLANLAPGPYQIVVGLYRPATGARLLLGGSTADALPLTELEITP